jgi:hypothetical protein
MIEFIVELADRPGSLAEFAQRLATAGVNIEALAGWNANGDGVIRMVVNDPGAARRVLTEAGIRHDERPVVTVSLPNRPGALADMASSLASAGINIEAVYVVGGGGEALRIAIAVDETESVAALLERGLPDA